MIPLRCACGELLPAREELAGLPVCPACGSPYPAPPEPLPGLRPGTRKRDWLGLGCVIALLAPAGLLVLVSVCHIGRERDRTQTARSLTQLALAMQAYH